jgi:glycosyltransferase involved in cell wall biosynthesis
MSGDNAGSTPLLGVGLPALNGELFIAQAIESILAQTFKDLRLFISDNCSSDGTAGICQTYAARDGRIVYSRKPENIGIIGNAVRVFRETRPSKYFTLIDHDDFRAPAFAERLIGLLEARPGATLAFCRHGYVDEAGRRLNLKGFEGISARGAAKMGSPTRARRLSVAPLCASSTPS